MLVNGNAEVVTTETAFANRKARLRLTYKKMNCLQINIQKNLG